MLRRFALAAAVLLTAAVAAQYQERFRPQYHISPAKNWTNDPNGLVYFAGEYHLFYQFNPFGDQWGHMSWGHAVSKDMVRWQELPVAIPESDGVMIFTGSTVVDARNTSGFCQGNEGCLVAVYTGHRPKSNTAPSRQTQNLAYSNDRGRTWSKYKLNPVIDLQMSDFRDPKVFWHEPTKRWVMAVALPLEHKVLFYASVDLKTWQKRGEFGGQGATGGDWECPELFPLPVEGAQEQRWVLKVGLNPGARYGGSGEQYFVGKFDGGKFTNQNPAGLTLWTDYGRDCYCGLTFNNLPADRKQAMIGWMSNWEYAGKLPTAPWRGQMTVPRTLSLRATPDGLRLFQQPAEALTSLRGTVVALQAQNVSGTNAALTASLPGQAYELQTTITPGTAREFGWNVLTGEGSQVTIGYDASKNELYVDRSRGGAEVSGKFPGRYSAPLALRDKPLSLRILVDWSSIEVFAQDGEVVMTSLVFPEAGSKGIAAFSTGGNVKEVKAQVWPLRSAW